MIFHNVTRQQLDPIAAFINVRTVDAYAPKGAVGVCLRPANAVAYRRYSAQSVLHGPARRVNAVCWCGHRRFLMELFNRYPDARCVTSSPTGRATIVADGVTDVGLNEYLSRPNFFSLAHWLDESAGQNVGQPNNWLSPQDLCAHDR